MLLQDDHINTYHARLRLRLIDQLQVPIFIVGLVLSVIQVSSIVEHDHCINHVVA